MKKPISTASRPRAREVMTWRQLCAIARTTITDDPSVPEWKERILDKVIALNFEMPTPRALHGVMDRYAHLLPPPPMYGPPPIHTRAEAEREEMTAAERLDPTKIPRADSRHPEGFERARPPSTSNDCGCSKPISGRRPLVCNLPKGHEGDHGLRMGASQTLFVRWARDAARDA